VLYTWTTLFTFLRIKGQGTNKGERRGEVKVINVINEKKKIINDEYRRLRCAMHW
jgi:hypothetical protein